MMIMSLYKVDCFLFKSKSKVSLQEPELLSFLLLYFFATNFPQYTLSLFALYFHQLYVHDAKQTLTVQKPHYT